MKRRASGPTGERAGGPESIERLIRAQVERELACEHPSRPDAAPPGRPADPHATERWTRLWEAWLGASLGQKLELARAFFTETSDLDSGMVLELMLELGPSLRRAGRGAALDRLIDCIAARHPSAYAEESFWFDSWRVENALRTGADARRPLSSAAAQAADRPEPFVDLLDQVLYFNRRDDALAALGASWPALRRSDAPPDLLRELRRRAVLLGTAGAIDGGMTAEAAVGTAAAAYADPCDGAWLATLAAVAAPSVPGATVTLPPAGEISQAEWLALELALGLRPAVEWAGARFVLAHDELVRYLSRRAGGREPSRRGRGEPPIIAAFTRARIQAYLGGERGLMGAAAYRTAALAAALPTLLALLYERGLAPVADGWRLYATLRDPVTGLAGAVGELAGDVELARAVAAAWESPPEALARQGKLH